MKLSLSSLFLHNAIFISSVFSFPSILFKGYSQILVVFTCLTYTTTSWTCSLRTIHAASSCSYSIRSNFCCYVDLLKAHFLSHYASGQTLAMTLWSKTKSKFPILSLNSSLLQKPVHVCLLYLHPCELLLFPINILSFPTLCHFSQFSNRFSCV